MNPVDRRLKQHLAIAVMAKLAILAVLWLAFFQRSQVPGRQPTAAVSTASHVLGIPAPQGESL